MPCVIEKITAFTVVKDMEERLEIKFTFLFCVAELISKNGIKFYHVLKSSFFYEMRRKHSKDLGQFQLQQLAAKFNVEKT